MTLYVVSCALRDASHDYSPLWSFLESKGAARAMEAVWLLDSTDAIALLTQSILPLMREQDRLLIGELGAWSATHLLPEAEAYLRNSASAAPRFS